MNISKKFFELLKNFSTINNSILFNEEGYMKIRSRSNKIMAIARIEEDIPENVAIYDIQKFMTLLSLVDLEKADFSFSKDTLQVKSPNGNMLINLSTPDMITHSVEYSADDIKSKFSGSIASFLLQQDQLKSIMNASRVIDTDKAFINFNVKDEECLVTVKSDSASIKNIFTLTNIEDATGDCDINIIPNNLPLLTTDYDVTVVNDKLLKFKAKKVNLVYYCAAKG